MKPTDPSERPLPEELLRGWTALRQRIHHSWPEIDQDAFMREDPACTRQLLSRFLRAEDGNVGKALERLEKTATYRKRYAVAEFLRPGMARLLFKFPGAEMYFCSSAGLLDRSGTEYLVGRLLLCGEINPKNHLRAAMLVMERAAIDMLKHNTSGLVYILDLRPLDFHGTVSGTGGGKNLARDSHFNPKKARDKIDKDDDMLEWHECIAAGFPTLREALRILERHYPETLRKVFFFDAPFWFYAIFQVFALWVPRSKDKFVFVSKGKEAAILKEIDPSQLFSDFGGQARSLNKDAFVEEAIQAYDAQGDASMQPAKLGPSGGWEDALPQYALKR